MKIDKDTICCISIAERPGNFGATIFNTAFQKLGMNYIYKPFYVDSDNLESTIKGIRALGIRGCGVSMPHKTKVIRYLDKIDDTAKKIGAINTIVNDGGILTGYNTDYTGFRKALEEAYDIKNKKVFIIGSGGAARAIIVALKDCGAKKIFITNRNEKRGKKLAEEFSIEYFPFDKRTEARADLLVNATPVGMPPKLRETVISEGALSYYNACFDIVVSAQKTRMVEATEELGKIAIPGFKMALYQGVAQYKLYTGLEIPTDVIRDGMREYFSK